MSVSEQMIITSSFEKKLIINFRKKLKKGKMLKCPKCKHIWIYGGKSNKYTSCPTCLYGSVNINRHSFKVVNDEKDNTKNTETTKSS